MSGGGSLLRPGTPEPQFTVTLGGREFPFARARLGAYLHLVLIQEEVDKAAKTGEGGSLADGLFHYLEAGCGLDRATFETASWIEVALAYWKVQGANSLPESQQLALVRNASKGKSVRWDYPARPIMVWLDMFARAYGWRPDETLALYPEEAIAFAQEIEAHDYYEHRFLHALSQVAYQIGASGKATYRPLDEPYWMVMGTEPKKTMIDKRTLPLGLVIYPANAPEELKH